MLQEMKFQLHVQKLLSTKHQQLLTGHLPLELQKRLGNYVAIEVQAKKIYSLAIQLLIQSIKIRDPIMFKLILPLFPLP